MQISLDKTLKMVYNEPYKIVVVYFLRTPLYGNKERKRRMTNKNVTVINSVGLHARPATYFITKANEFKCSIWLEKGDRRVNAKSLLGVLSLGVVRDNVVGIIADGVDEKQAIETLSEIIESSFSNLR